MPATAAAISITSTISRRLALICRRSVIPRLGRRCCQAAITAGPRTATISTAIGGHQPPAGPAPCTEPAPGTARTARTTPSTAAGMQTSAAPAAVPRKICRSDAPRALITASSPRLRIATIRPASSSTARPVIVRLT